MFTPVAKELIGINIYQHEIILAESIHDQLTVYTTMANKSIHQKYAIDFIINCHFIVIDTNMDFWI